MEPLKTYGFSPEQLEAFAAFVQAAPPEALIRANPRDWAARLGWPERDLLALLVAAAAERLVTFHWDVHCPACNFQLQSAPLLGEVHPEADCPACGGHGHSALDLNVTVSVSVLPALRPLPLDNQTAASDSPHPPLPALRLINTLGFRTLLLRQVLPEGQALGVQDLTIFFSDLRASTALYHKYGDAQAYAFVSEHFRRLFNACRAHDGDAIKTIGDGVMGIFERPTDALDALRDIAAALHDLNAELALPPEDRLQLKIGLHRGPCIVVTLNERLDYFGETVNIAARLNGLADADSVLLSDAVRQALADDDLPLEASSLQLRGISGTLAAWKLDFHHLV